MALMVNLTSVGKPELIFPVLAFKAATLLSVTLNSWLCWFGFEEVQNLHIKTFINLSPQESSLICIKHFQN
ncbi:hypothetical protein NIES2098_24830 [Calothrix sp. NIES-2098]|nr:hypothetical protein NIES2098_24830 [Calothrix sp. NIES-2098]